MEGKEPVNKAPSRPASAWNREPSYGMPAIPGGLPPTPGASEGDYVLVEKDKERTSADYVVVDQDGDMPPPPPPKSAGRRYEE